MTHYGWTALDFGWTAPPLLEQLGEVGLDAEMIRHFERDGQAIRRLHMRRVISDRECQKAMKRLTAQIEAYLAKARRRKS